ESLKGESYGGVKYIGCKTDARFNWGNSQRDGAYRARRLSLDHLSATSGGYGSKRCVGGERYVGSHCHGFDRGISHCHFLCRAGENLPGGRLRQLLLLCGESLS